jgi:hypothetical protein
VISTNVNSSNLFRDLLTINVWDNVSCHVANGDYQTSSVLTVIETEAEEAIDAIANCWNLVALEKEF